AHRSNLPGLLIDIQVGRAAEIDGCVCEIDRALCVVREFRQEFRTGRNYLMRLTADAGYLTCQFYVLVVPVHAPEGVARERAGGSLVTGHDDTGIETAGQ